MSKMIDNAWINVADEVPDPDRDWCILIWLPKLDAKEQTRVGIPVICHYLEHKEGYFFPKIIKGYFSPRGKMPYQPVRDFQFWKRCDYIFKTSPPCSDMKNELLDTTQFTATTSPPHSPLFIPIPTVPFGVEHNLVWKKFANDVIDLAVNSGESRSNLYDKLAQASELCGEIGRKKLLDNLSLENNIFSDTVFYRIICTLLVWRNEYMD